MVKLYENGLTARASNILRYFLKDVEVTPENVATIDWAALRREPNCGKKTVEEVKAWVQANGFQPQRLCPACGRPLVERH